MSKCQYLLKDRESSICLILKRCPLGLGSADGCFYSDNKIYEGMKNCELRKKGYRSSAEDAENFLKKIGK